MTRDKFRTIQAKRGYEVSDLGLMTICRCVDADGEYIAISFWNADGTPDFSKKGTQSLRKI